MAAPQKKDHHQALWIWCALVILFFGAGWRHFQDIGRRPLSKKERVHTLASQIGSDIEQTLKTHASSSTLWDWHQSGFTPADVLKNARALNLPEARQALCQKLRKLSDPQLAVFASEIERPENAKFLKCMVPLREKIRNHWHHSRKALTKQWGSRLLLPPEIKTARIEIPAGGSLSPLPLPPGHWALAFEGHLHPEHTRRILKTLNALRVKATFFPTGASSDAQPALAYDLFATGHAVGFTAFQETSLLQQPITEVERNIQRSRGALEGSIRFRQKSSHAEFTAKLFHFPFQQHDEHLAALVSREGLVPVFRDHDSQDWKHVQPGALISHVQSIFDSKSGGVLGLRSDLEQTVVALPYILAELHQRGWTTSVLIPSEKKLAYCKNNACQPRSTHSDH